MAPIRGVAVGCYHDAIFLNGPGPGGENQRHRDFVRTIHASHEKELWIQRATARVPGRTVLAKVHL